ncbi:FG-GAP-like repeat-containing protein [Ideonella livida]|uniref:SbsA Ig-like domain-containing protein n=1 Tax=Ideonella livida TaxID=2707176 RepID=A0A7C9TME2_9BURK|nr:FG-GAP-like repeat-containing protein [Ideonella livida]NDY93961.1 hypothetical protein [Ideonella livida]
MWADYLPLGLDNRWVYQAGDDVQVVTVLSSTTMGSTTQAVTRVHALQAAWSGNQDVQLDATGVSASEEEDGDLVLQGRNGWTVGQEQTLASGTDSSADWDDDAVPDKVSFQSKLLVLASEAVATPAGDFAETLHVRRTRVWDVDSSVVKRTVRTTVVTEEWYAKGVGMLKDTETITLDGTAEPTSTRLLQGYRVGGVAKLVVPTVASVTPANGWVTAQVPLQITFDQEMDRTVLPSHLVRVTAGGKALAGSLSWLSGKVLQWAPDAEWPTGTQTAVLAAQAVNWVGVASAGATWTFTQDAVPPTFTSSHVSYGAVDVPTDQVLAWVFSEPVQVNASALSFKRTVGGVSQEVPFTLRVEGATVYITPTSALDRLTAYRLTTVGSGDGIRDLAGNALALGSRWPGDSFTTEGAFFRSPQTVSGLTPESTFPFMRTVTVAGESRASLLYGGGISSRIYLHRQLAEGGLRAAPTSFTAAGGCDVSDAVLMDVDGDGLQDLLAVACNAQLQWFKGDATGSFGPAQVLTADLTGLSNVKSVEVIHLAGQARASILVDGRTLLVAPTSGASFTERRTLVADGYVGQTRVADVNGDGREDIVLRLYTTATSEYAIVVLRQDGVGAFSQETLRFPGYVWFGMAVGDLNSDGLADIGVYGQTAAGGFSRGVMYAGSASTMGAVVPLQFPAGTTPPTGSAAMAMADVDGDGRTDLVALLADPSRTYTFLQQADGTLGVGQADTGSTDAAGYTAFPVALADFTGDGRPDLVVYDKILVNRSTTVAASARQARAVATRLLASRGTAGVLRSTALVQTQRAAAPSGVIPRRAH